MNQVRRENETHFHFMGMGISGGEEGARHGPCMMPGGSKFAYDALRPVLEAMSCKVGGQPCVIHVGPDGAGHVVSDSRAVVPGDAARAGA